MSSLWDEYNETMRAIANGISPTRYKFVFNLHANATFATEQKFDIDGVTITLTPVSNGSHEIDNDLTLSCVCTAILLERPEYPRQAFSDSLSLIFAMACSSYSLSPEIEEFVELNGEWLRFPAGYGKGYMSFLPNGKRDEELNQRVNITLSAIDYAQPKVAKKLRECVQLLATGNRLERDWHADAFLNYYRVVEIVAGELKQPWAGAIRESCTTATELVQHKIVGDRTQRIIVYFVCKALELNDVQLAEAIEVAQCRNDIAHSSRQPDAGDLGNCKQLAYSCFLEFAWRICRHAEPERWSQKWVV